MQEVPRGRSVTSGPISEEALLHAVLEVEPRSVKQYKYHHCCSCKNYWGKGMEGGKKVSLHCFLADQKIMSLWEKNAFWGIL